MKSHWLEHKGKRIFFADYSGFGRDFEALRLEVEAAVDTIAKEPRKTVLVLSDFHATVETMDNLNTVRKLLNRSNPAVIKRALLGVSGMRRIFITTFSNVTGDTLVQAFDDQAAALDWLVAG